MLTKNHTHSDSEHAHENDAPSQAPQPASARTPDAPRKRALLYVGLFVAAILLAAVLFIAGIIAGRAGEETTSVNTQTDQPAIVTESDGSEAAAGTDAAAPVVVDPTDAQLAALTSFGDYWTAADWDGMGTISNDDVVATATEWYDAGGHLVVNADFIPEQCTTAASGTSTCELIYAPTDGFGLIFNFTLQPGDSGMTISDMSFGGDAG